MRAPSSLYLEHAGAELSERRLEILPQARASTGSNGRNRVNRSGRGRAPSANATSITSASRPATIWARPSTSPGTPVARPIASRTSASSAPRRSSPSRRWRRKRRSLLRGLPKQLGQTTPSAVRSPHAHGQPPAAPTNRRPGRAEGKPLAEATDRPKISGGSHAKFRPPELTRQIERTQRAVGTRLHQQTTCGERPPGRASRSAPPGRRPERARRGAWQLSPRSSRAPRLPPGRPPSAVDANRPERPAAHERHESPTPRHFPRRPLSTQSAGHPRFFAWRLDMAVARDGERVWSFSEAAQPAFGGIPKRGPQAGGLDQPPRWRAPAARRARRWRIPYSHAL